MRERCHDLGILQDCCAPGGLEGGPDRARCDFETVHPVWVLRGGEFAPTGGELGLGDNPFRNAVKGTGTIAVCGQGVCSKALGFGGAPDGPPPLPPTLPPGPTPEPSPAPTPGPTPQPSPSPTPSTCVFTPEDFGRSGKWGDIKITSQASGKFNIDSTAKVCMRERCHGLGILQDCCPPGGLEGGPDRARCDFETVHPVWVLRGGEFAPTGGELGLGDNPFRNAVRGTGTIAVCGQGVCSRALGFGGAADGPPPTPPPAPPSGVSPAPLPTAPPSPSPAGPPPGCPSPTGIDFDVSQGTSGSATKYAVQARFRLGSGPLRHECWPDVTWTNLAGQGNLQSQGGGLLLVWSKAHRLHVRGCAGPVCDQVSR
jgi:hypothetical protein